MANNTLRLRCSGQDYTLTLDLAALMGDTVEELEEHVGGEGVIAWMQRMQQLFERGVRIRDLRSRDIIAMVFMARSQAEPGTTWSDVSRSIAPYTLEVREDDKRPNLGAQVPAPAPLAPTLEQVARQVADAVPGATVTYGT